MSIDLLEFSDALFNLVIERDALQFEVEGLKAAVDRELEVEYKRGFEDGLQSAGAK